MHVSRYLITLLSYYDFQMIERLLGIDLMGFCEDPGSLSSLLGVQSSPSFTQFQNGLCELNWTQINEEMKLSGSRWSDFIVQVSKLDSFLQHFSRLYRRLEYVITLTGTFGVSKTLYLIFHLTLLRLVLIHKKNVSIIKLFT